MHACIHTSATLEQPYHGYHSAGFLVDRDIGSGYYYTLDIVQLVAKEADVPLLYQNAYRVIL